VSSVIGATTTESRSSLDPPRSRTPEADRADAPARSHLRPARSLQGFRAMTHLKEVLAARSDGIIARWLAAVRSDAAVDSMSRVELVDHMPQFLAELVAALEREAGQEPHSQSPSELLSAATHGKGRLRLGFSLDAVVREYGALRNAIVETALEAHVELGPREMQLIFEHTIEGIAQAVLQYSRERDAEVQRQANEHFAFVAHELRNPLAAAVASFERLAQFEPVQGSARALGALGRGLARLSELIGQSLDVARVSSGIDLRPEPTTLVALLEGVASESRFEAEEKGVKLSLSIEKDRQLQLDVRLIRSALDNLVRNAVKFTHPEGTVAIRGSVSNGRVAVEVEDCCGGLPPGKVEEAFAPFVRLENRGGGFGLGLAIAKQAVDAHGGAIRIQNLPGKGCVFVLEVPVGTGGG
jgi:signal transduction histidine kinase